MKHSYKAAGRRKNPEGSGSRRQGSTLLLAIIFTTVLSLVAGSVIGRIVHERRLAHQSIEHAALLYIAEGYIEKAMWAVNNSDWSGESWESFNDDEDRYMPFTKVMLGTQEVYVHALVVNANDNPTIYSEARANPGSGRSLSRQIRIEYNARTEFITEEGSGIPGGLIVEGKLDLSGQPKLNSYDSRIGRPDPVTNKGDQITVATTNRSSDGFKLSSDVEIYGFAGTGRRNPDISGGGIRIYGTDTPSGTKVDWNRVYKDFTFDFPAVTQPSWSGANGSLPGGSTKQVGTVGTTTQYRTDKLDLSGSDTLVVTGHVQMYLSDGSSISGTIQIEDDSLLEIYTPGDFTLSGGAVINKTSRPQNMAVYGTASSPNDQTFSLSGQGLAEMIFYAPNAKINFSGQGDFAGSAVGNEITMSGQTEFHYDISLGGGDTNSGDETRVTIGDVTQWHDTSASFFNFDIETYVKNNQGTYYIPI